MLGSVLLARYPLLRCRTVRVVLPDAFLLDAPRWLGEMAMTNGQQNPKEPMTNGVKIRLWIWDLVLC